MTLRAPEVAAFGGIFLMGNVIALLGAVLPLVSAPLGLGLDSVGNLFLVLNAVMLAGSVVFGLVVDRFGYRGALTGGPSWSVLPWCSWSAQEGRRPSPEPLRSWASGAALSTGSPTRSWPTCT